MIPAFLDFTLLYIESAHESERHQTYFICIKSYDLYDFASRVSAHCAVSCKRCKHG